MTDCTELKQSIISILEENRYMSECCVAKCNKLLESATNVDVLSVDPIVKDVENILSRIRINLDDWTLKINNAKSKFQEQNIVISAKRKINLSLRKNGDTQDTDVEDDDVPIDEPRTDDSCVDNQKILQINEVAIASNAESEKKSDCSSSDVTIEKDSEELTELSQQGEEKESPPSETSSFDFDCDIDIEQDREQAQKDNNELLELLNKATNNVTSNSESPPSKTDNEEKEKVPHLAEADERSIGNESSLHTSDLDLSETDESEPIISDLSDDDWEPDDTNEDSNHSEEERVSDNLEQQPNRTFSISLRRVDHCSDSEIEKLCDLNSINKRKCKKMLGRTRKRLAKRPRLLSTSSSSDSRDSSTPDLPTDLMDLEGDCLPSKNIEKDSDEILANLFWADMSDDEELSIGDLSSESSDTDIEKDPAAKSKDKAKESNEAEKNHTETELNNVDETMSAEEIKDEIMENVENDKQKKLAASWRKDDLLRGHLWTSSEEESPDSDTDKPKKDKTEKTNSFVSNGLGRKRSVENLETTVISDSDSSIDSDDCTFVNEYQNSDEMNSSKGRRNIRAIMSEEELDKATQQAKHEEEERIKRLEQFSQSLDVIQSQTEEFVLDADVNTGAPLIIVDRGLAKKLKPHQETGVRFMWEACYESVTTLKTKPGTGCILAHCMGLGKTRQVITLIHTLFNHKVTSTSHVLVICPLSTVSNWKNEFSLVFSDATTYCTVKCNFLVKEDLHEKSKIVDKWHQKGGVLVMGYEAFEGLTSAKLVDRMKEADRNKLLKALLDPGPDLIVCDEAHLLKNGETRRNKALMLIKTKRRIALTGTPLQNNLMEYYYMVHFVKPHLLGTYKEYKNRFANPIENGQYFDSGLEDIKLMKKRTHVLTKLLKKTIHRVESKILADYLPPILDYTIYFTLNTLQVALYEKYIKMVKSNREKLTRPVVFQDFRITSFISLHPYVLHLHYTQDKKEKKVKETEIVRDNFENVDKSISRIPGDWYDDLFPQDVSSKIEFSAKLKFMMAVIDGTIQHGEKALIFAHYLVELDIVEHFLRNHGTPSLPQWKPNIDYFRMDGTVKPQRRSEMCREFNSNRNIKIFLISHKVGGLGLNLTGASRVILIGTTYNPSYDVQSIYRAYRFGQSKPCFVYRLLSIGTMEEKIYQRCVVKLAVAGTVVDKFHFDRHYNATDLQQMYEFNYEQYKERPIPKVPGDKLFATLIQNNADIYSYLEHNALLENKPDEELADEDKKLAWEEFNNEEALSKANPNLVPNPLSIASGKLQTQRSLPMHSNGVMPPATMPSNKNRVLPMISSILAPMNREAVATSSNNRQAWNVSMSSNNNRILPAISSILAPMNREAVPTPSINRQAWNNYVVQPRPIGKQFPNSADKRFLNFCEALQNRTNVAQTNNAEEATSSGEFNYALNK